MFFIRRYYRSRAIIYNTCYKTLCLAVTLSTEDNEELLKQLESDLKRTINLNKHQSKIRELAQHRYLDVLYDPNF